MRIRKRSVALGIFDGVHLGHRAVMKMTEKSGIPAVFTFNNTSLRTKQGRMIEYIYTDAQKSALIGSLGIREIFSENFSNIRDMSGNEFAENIIVRKLEAASVACGRDFRFGRDASCGINELSVLGRRYGFEVMVAEDVLCGGEPVSSGRIRSLLRQGDVTTAAELLDRSYMISGRIVHGRQIGRTLDFPTINQLFAEGQLIPCCGVYASETVIGGYHYDSVTNIGVKPTVGRENKPLAETHIIGFNGDLYGKELDVELRRFLRPEVKFNSLEELREQISKDVSNSVLSNK